MIPLISVYLIKEESYKEVENSVLILPKSSQYSEVFKSVSSKVHLKIILQFILNGSNLQYFNFYRINFKFAKKTFNYGTIFLSFFLKFIYKIDITKSMSFI
jgi:hypothetical protein